MSQDETQHYPGEHEIVQQLMDMKLIHVIEPDTSAASSRQGRYEAYALDFSLFMEPRRRYIEITPFWERGEDSHKKGIREAPVYTMERLRSAFEGVDATRPEDILNDLPKENEKACEQQTVQGLLFEE